MLPSRPGVGAGSGPGPGGSARRPRHAPAAHPLCLPPPAAAPPPAAPPAAARILAEANNLRRAGEEFANDKLGTLTVAATHTQARYALPKAVASFKRRYPNVELHIQQGNPTQICEQVLAGGADMAVATEMIDH